jgi:hypothetical protein
MSLGDAFRKAASLLIETSPPEPATETDPLADAPNDPLARVERQSLDVDKLLQEQGIGTKKPAASTGSNAQPQTKTVEQVVQDSPGPNLKDISVAAPIGNQPLGTTGKPLSPTDIYQAAKLAPAPFSAEQMLDMLHGLPPELPLEVKRQTVKVTLGALGKTMGATPDTVVADASRKMAALKSYVEHLQKRTEEFAKSGEAEIASLQKQIEEKRRAIENARGSLAASTTMCVQESERLDDVLEFFSLDVPPSKYAPQKQG